MHYLHRKLVVVGGDVGRGIDWRKLVLRRSNLVVFRLGKNAELPQFFVEVLHICRYPRLNHTEVVVFHLLSLRRLGTEERSARKYEVLARIKHCLVYKEVFLFGAYRSSNALDVGIAEESKHSQSLLVEGFHRTEQRRLFVKRLAAVGAKRGRNTQGLALDKSVRSRVPSRIASRLKSSSDTARRKPRIVRLTLDEFLARKLHYYSAVGSGSDKAIVLF